MELNWKAKQTRERFQEALNALVNTSIPVYMIDEWLDNTGDNVLQEFMLNHQTISWATGIGLIESARLVVETAAENANIDCEGNIQ